MANQRQRAWTIAIPDVRLSVMGDVVSIELHCGDEYMAQVLLDDLGDRARVGRVCVEFGVKAKAE